MSSKDLLKEYFSQIGNSKVHEILWIPHTKMGVHPLELSSDVLFKKCTKYVRAIESNVEFLKRCKLRRDYSSVLQPDTLYKLIESWNMNALMGFSREMSSAELEYFQEIDEQCFYSVIYHNVLHGKTEKRGLRLHFTGVFVPITLKCNDVIRSIPLQLKSISKRSILFKISSHCKSMMEMAKGFEISLDHNDLFQCENGLDHNLFSILPFHSHLKEKRFKECRPKKFSVSMKKVSFALSLIEKAKSLGQTENYYLCIPFEALEDPVLLTMADYGKDVSSEVEVFQNDLKDLVLAS